MFGVLHVFTENHRAQAEVTIQNKKDYCAKHGYKYIEINSHKYLDLSKGDIPCTGLPPANIAVGWSKIKLLENILRDNPTIDWIFWIDTDALFMDFNVKLEDLVDDESFFIVGRDCNGINVGTFFIRNCEKSLRFLKDIWETGPVVGNWWTETEQGQIDLHGLKKEYRNGYSVVSNKEFNSYIHNCDPGVMPCHKYEENDGHFVVHLPGQPDKENKLRDLLTKVVK